MEVERLNIDAASFVQMEAETGKNALKISDIVLQNTRNFGKQQNRVTGSGGMLIGRVAQVGSEYRGALKVKKGDRVASLISLTLTPLHLEKVRPADLATHQIEVSGHAILFESSPAAVLPDDLPETAAMAAFDVCGAPALVKALTKAGQTVVVIGAGGKAGLLCCVAARKKLGKAGKIIAIEPFPAAAKDVESLGVCDAVIQVDATDPIAVRSSVQRATRGKMGDVVINVASVPGTEMGAILAAKPKGVVVFFSMATSFTKVALGSEGIACTAQLIFGNGYYPGHGQLAIGLLRKEKKLNEIFIRRYCR